MATGIYRMLQSEWFKKQVLPPYAKAHPIDANKIIKALNGPPFPPNPKDSFALGIVEEIKYHKQTRPSPPPPPPPPPPDPVKLPWDSGYAPRAYNQGSRGQNCIFNVHINCVLQSDGSYIDRNGITYSDSGLCNGGRTETPDIQGLKPADMKDQHEPWDAYEWFGDTIGPNKENYPAQSYDR